MRKPLFLNHIPRYIGMVAVIAAINVSPTTANDTRADRMNILKAKIDSLEVEKQSIKRTGRSLDDLERVTERLRDSVTLLREELRSENAHTAIPSPAPQKKLLPTTFRLIDKIVIGAGAATVLFLLFFLLFYLSAAARRRRHVTTRTVQQRHEAPPQKPTATALHAYGAQMKEQLSTPSPAPPTPPRAAPISPQKSAADAPPEDLSGQVLKAWSAGQDAKTIAQRFHIGVDQVRLIVKMAKKS